MYKFVSKLKHSIFLTSHFNNGLPVYIEKLVNTQWYSKYVEN